MLGAALAISMTQLPVWADDEGTDTGTGTGVAAPAAPEQPATPGSDEAPADQGTPPASPPPASSSGGLQYGGRATGPSPLPLLQADPAYPVAEPPTNEFLPEGLELDPEKVDDAGVFQRNVVCDPVAKPGLIAVANLLGQNYDRPGYTTSRSCIDLRSEHYDGRAVDWQLNAFDPQERRIGDAAVTWLTENDGEVARRLGIQSIIWNSHSWHADGGVWQGYVGQSAHTDHVHISLNWDGANMRTSWWTGVPLEVEQADKGPCSVIGGAYAAVPQAPRQEECAPAQFWPEDTGYATLRPGGQGAGVALVQPLLDVPQTGLFDGPTREALITWQGEKGIPQTGVLDQLTYAVALGWEIPELPEGALAVDTPDYATTEYTPLKRTVLTEGDEGEDVKVLQEALGVDGDGFFGPLTAAALTEFAEEHPLVKDDITSTDTLVWHLLEQRDYPHLAFYDMELEIGMGLEPGTESYPVQLLQRQLELEDDGIFGPMTEQGVRDAQTAAELEPTGIVDGATWRAIDDAVTARAEEKAAKDKAEKDGDEKSDDKKSDEKESDEKESSEKKSDGTKSDGKDKGTAKDTTQTTQDGTSDKAEKGEANEPGQTPLYDRLLADTAVR